MERLALYLRLSLEDEGEKDESNSISNQRKLIYEYIHHDSELSGYEAVEFSDDGFSGTLKISSRDAAWLCWVIYSKITSSS